MGSRTSSVKVSSSIISEEAEKPKLCKFPHKDKIRLINKPHVLAVWSGPYSLSSYQLWGGTDLIDSQCVHFYATKLEIMQCAVAKWPRVSISAVFPHGIQISSLLDSCSNMILLRQSYFKQHLLLKIKKADTCILFNLTVTNDGQLPIKMYAQLNITFLGLKVLNVGLLIIDNPSQVLEKKHQSKLPCFVGWNLVSYPTMCLSKNMGHQDLTLLHVQRELILCTSPNYMSITTQTQVKVMDWK